MRVAAVIFTVAAMLLARPPGRWLVRIRLGGGPADFPVEAQRIRRLLPLAAVAVGCVFALAMGGSLAQLIAGFTAIGVCWVWARLRRNTRKAHEARVCSQQIAEIVDSLAAELGAGILAGQALEHLAVDMTMLQSAAAASRMGGDVAGALRVTAQQPGAGGLIELAAAWEVSERSGAPMARVLDCLGDGIRDEREAQREIAAGLGPAKATARLMAVLPIVGLGMGMSMGARPLHVLINTVAGSLCLAAGAALACAGVWWVDQIAARAERA